LLAAVLLCPPLGLLHLGDLLQVLGFPHLARLSQPLLPLLLLGDVCRKTRCMRIKEEREEGSRVSAPVVNNAKR
jgi:hypothetical protein